jgi:molecular chaperone GrpE
MSESTGKPNPEQEVEQALQPETTVETSEVSELEALKAELQAAQEEVGKAKEVYLRLAADMENLRRRTQEDVAKAHKFAIEAFAEGLLPVRDTLEMALIVENQTLDALKEGVGATLRQLEAAFERGKIKLINPEGEKFDPNAHQAVAMVPGNSVEPPVPANHVVAVLQKGYALNERVLRPALVSVAQ